MRHDTASAARERRVSGGSRPFVLLAQSRQDLAHAARLLRRAPGFTLTAVLSLGLGLGAALAIASLIDAVLLAPLPVRDAHRLVELSRGDRRVGGGIDGGMLSYPMYEAIAQRSRTVTDAIAIPAGRLTAGARLDGAPIRDVQVSPVSGNYFTALGVQPALGRPLTDADLVPSNAAIIGHDLWRTDLAADPHVLGRTLHVGFRTYTIVGIAPAGFSGIATGQPIDVWVPLTWIPAPQRASRDALMFRVLARLRPGATAAQAQAELAVIARQWSADWQLEETTRVEMTPASGGLTRLRRAFAQPLTILLTIVALLLMVASANVANLLLARASARQREIGLRLALGAGRARLIRQLLTESALLGTLGAALGLLIAPAAAQFLVRFLSSTGGAVTLPFTLDSRMLIATLSIAGVTVLLFGLAPALAATRLDISTMFKGGAAAGGGWRPAGPRRLLMVAQVALCCVLLAGAVLFARSLHRLTTMDVGMQAENVLLLQLNGAAAGLTGEARANAYARVLDRFAREPGVHSAALSSESLFTGNAWMENVSLPGDAPRAASAGDRKAILLIVSSGFFRTLQTPLLRGRDFDARDRRDGAPVVIINEALARRHFGDADPIGRTLQVEGVDSARPLTIVGVVHDTRYANLRDTPPRILYLPYQQRPEAPGHVTVAARTGPDPERMTETLWQAARAESSALRFAGATTQQALVDGTTARDRMLAQLAGLFGLMAIGLVCLGLYGLTAYEVSRRTREMGVRLALGARRADIVRLVLGGSLTLVCAGATIGLGAAIALARFVESLLFGVSGSDALTLLPPIALLLAVGALASWWPARRAARLDPMASLTID